MPYRDFYHMQAEAFGSLPVLNLFYSSRTHQDGWRYLVGGIAAREPFLLVTGDYGMGKTLLCMMLVRLLEKKQSASFVHITDPHCGFSGILRQTAACLAIGSHEKEESGMLAALYDHLQNQGRRQTVSVIIDDAQELDSITLVRLRAFANFNRDGFFPVQLIFFAHPSLADLLKAPQLMALDQRIKRRHRLMPLTLQETKEYIYFRLFKSGAPGTPSFTEDALQEIYASTGGVPRLINNICDASLTRSASKMETVISRGAVREARADAGALFAKAGAQAAGEQPRSDGAARAFHAPPVCIAPLEQLPPPVPGSKTAMTVPKQPPRALFIKAAAVAAACIAAFLLIQHYDGGAAPDTTLQDHMTAGKTAPLRNAVGAPGIMENVTRAAQPPASEPLPAALPADIRPAITTPLHDRYAEDAPGIIDNKTAGHHAAASPPAPDVLVASDNASSGRNAGMLAEQPAASAPGNPSSSAALSDREPPTRPYTLKVSCFNTPESAKNAAVYYAKKKLSPFAAKINLQQQGIWWIFYLGGFASRDEAFAARASCNLTDAQVIPMPFACRVGVFASIEKAGDLNARLEQLGCCPYAIDNGNGTVSLFTGAFMQRFNAEARQKTLADKNIESAIHTLKAVSPQQAGTRSVGSMRGLKP